MTPADLLPWFVKLVAASLWRTLRRLPVDMFAAVAACFLLAGFTWWLLLPETTTSALQTAAGAGLAACYGIAGMVWGLHRALRAGTTHALTVYETDSPKMLDAILDPLVTRLPLGDAKISIADVKRSLDDYSRAPLPDASSRWLAAVSRLVGRIARWGLRQQLRLVAKIVAALEEKGETDISPMSLKNYLRDQMVNVSLSAARRRFMLADYAVAAAVFLLLTAPPGLAQVFTR